MCEVVKKLVLSVCQSVCQFVSPVKKNLNLDIDRVKPFTKLTEVTYLYFIGSKAVLYAVLFQQFPIECCDHLPL